MTCNVVSYNQDMRKLVLTSIILAVIASGADSSAAVQESITIRTEHGSPAEVAAEEQLRRLLSDYDLKSWTFTREIMIDERAIPHSHPVLTLHTKHLKQDDEMVSTYVHEQLHWFLSEHPTETQAAMRDLIHQYPTVPVGFPQGAQDRDSTYLHLLVCRLEQQADLKLLGPARTDSVMQFWAKDHYTWIYQTVLEDGPQIDAVLKLHHLDSPKP